MAELPKDVTSLRGGLAFIFGIFHATRPAGKDLPGGQCFCIFEPKKGASSAESVEEGGKN
jgi:hypothetical protein